MIYTEIASLSSITFTKVKPTASFAVGFFISSGRTLSR